MLIKNYLNFIEKCFLLFFVNKFDYSIRKQHANPKKAYAVDVALAREVSFKFSEDKGKIFENIIFIELKRRNKEIFYHKNKHECDFVVKEGLKIKEAIQVCYSINEDNRERELKGLVEAICNYGLKKGVLITSEQEEEFKINTKKIIVKPLWKWLLDYF